LEQPPCGEKPKSRKPMQVSANNKKANKCSWKTNHDQTIQHKEISNWWKSVNIVWVWTD
jgi:hypothetical protein